MNIFLPDRLVRASLVTLVLLIPAVARTQVVINEVLADNQTTLLNEGIYPDWIELHNTSTVAVDLSDWSLSQSTATPRQYIFPAGTSIPGSGYLLVYCDLLTNAPGLHANFRLGRSGENVSLYGPPSAGGIRQDSVDFGLQVSDASVSRIPDGAPNNWRLTAPTPGAANGGELSIAPPTNLKVNEVMANPNGGDDWFELFNPETNHVQLDGLVWSDRTTIPATNRAIASLSFIAPGGFIQFIADDRDVPSDHTSFRLSSSGDNVILYAPDRSNVVERVTYTTPQANGVSFGRLPDGSTNIVTFAAGRSTPGESNFQSITEIVVNEVVTHTDPPLEDAIELYNPTTNAVDISYWWLSNSRDNPQKYQIPANTVVPPGGYIVFYEWPFDRRGFNSNSFGTNMSFTLNSARGDQVYLHTADSNGNLTYFRTSRDFGPAANGVSFGRYVRSDNNTDFVAMSQRTFGSDNPGSLADFRTGTGLPNAYPLVGPLVINEIMYHPPDIDNQGTNVDNNLDEYIEIYNISPAAVQLFDPIVYPFADGRTNTWRLRGVVDFDFPANVTLGSSNYLLVVNFDPRTNVTQLDAFRTKFGVPQGIQIFGPYSSELGNGGGSVELYRPDVPQPPGRVDEGLVPYIRIDRVQYEDEAPWPAQPDGNGPSLQRLHVFGYGNDPTNWVASAATPGTVFIPNTPPFIFPISDMTSNEMQRIVFTINATDTNLPAQTLSYSLLGPPVGATISSNGVFRWRPSEEQGPGTYSISVRVTDSGLPSQSSTQTFRINVNEVNRPPTFNIRERWVKALNTLVFLTGRDEDVPPQFVDFSIAGTAPTGLEVDPGTGLVMWTPTEDQASTNAYRVTVQATDDGEPPLTSQFTYSIHVLPSDAVLIVADVFNIGLDVVVAWEATVGKTYRVDYIDSLEQPNWQPASDPMGAFGTTMSWSQARFATQRFYRVVQLD